jgi:hypothetical protein
MSTGPADRVGSDAVPGNPSPPTSPLRPAVPVGRTLSSQVSALRTAVLGADPTPVTGADSRGGESAMIRAHACAIADGVEIIDVAGRRAGIDEAAPRAVRGDVVTMPGKGHERGQEVDGEVVPFDGRVEPADALRKVAVA